MLCPACYEPNLPGVDVCVACSTDMTDADRPVGYDRVERSLLEDPVASLALRPPVTVYCDDNLATVVDVMHTHHVGAVLVLDHAENVVGILTERDFLTKIVGQVEYEDRLVQDYMSRDPETVSSEAPIAFVLGKMALGKYRHVPVVDCGRAVGMLSVRDVLRHIVSLR
jgi:CBS domain-containing protein